MAIRQLTAGGGIYVRASGTRPTRIRRSSIYNNATTGSTASGGGLYHLGGFLYVSNSSIFGNSAAGLGGGILSANSSTRTYLTHVTIVNNAAQNYGSIAVSSASQVYLRNSILGDSVYVEDQNLQITECSSDVYESVNNLVDDTTCSPDFQGEPGLASATQGSPAYWPLLGTSPAIGKGHATYCAEVGIDQRGARRPSTGCDLGAYEHNPPSSQNGGSDSSESDELDDSAKVVCTGEQLRALGYRLSAVYGLCSGVQFQRVDQSGVGIQSVIDLGVVDAIDVWGYVDQGVEVCFTQSGYVVFLDAATSPRTVRTINPYLRDGYTCVTLNTAGTIVLTEQPLPTALGQAATAPGGALANCMVTTTHELNFRDGPAGMAIGNGIPNNATLTALSRTTDWFEVDFMGIAGWISAAYIVTQGNCG